VQVEGHTGQGDLLRDENPDEVTLKLAIVEADARTLRALSCQASLHAVSSVAEHFKDAVVAQLIAQKEHSILCQAGWENCLPLDGPATKLVKADRFLRAGSNFD
jgi:hypothetical protein